MLEPMLLEDLSDDELRARLVQHGAEVDSAYELVRHREDVRSRREIVAWLEDRHE